MSPGASHTPVSPETNADLVRLEQCHSMELFDTLESLLDRSEALDNVAAIVEGRIDAGNDFINDQIAILVSHTKSALRAIGAEIQEFIKVIRQQDRLFTIVEVAQHLPASKDWLCRNGKKLTLTKQLAIGTPSSSIRQNGQPVLAGSA